MTWADEIDVALRKSRSPYTAADFIRWLREGRLKFWVAERMHGSLWFRPDGGLEIGHVYGDWNVADADWLVSKMKDAAGKRFVEIKGRPGWERFLKMRGYTNGRIGWV